jgi:hypothetical protein
LDHIVYSWTIGGNETRKFVEASTKGAICNLSESNFAAIYV